MPPAVSAGRLACEPSESFGVSALPHKEIVSLLELRAIGIVLTYMTPALTFLLHSIIVCVRLSHINTY